jgi:hypothetical protein
LLFTLPPRKRAPAHFEGLPITRIGVMRAGRPGEVRFDGELLPPRGYDHFRGPEEVWDAGGKTAALPNVRPGPLTR